jgi:hypothetical protein
MRKETGKKIISVFLIIIFMFNITGCATTTNYYDKNIGNKKQYYDENNEMLDSVLKDLEIKENEKLLYHIAGAFLIFGLTFNGFYSSDKWKVWTVPIIVIALSIIGGWFLGGEFYNAIH